MKNLKVLSKRGLSLLIAGMMTASLMPMQAIAADSSQDYVYVYVNVSEGSVETGSETAPPTFEDFVEHINDDKTNEEKIDTTVPTLDKVTEAEGTVTESITKVEEADGTVKDFGDKPEFDKDRELSNAINSAKDGVKDALNDLVDAVPE